MTVTIGRVSLSTGLNEWNMSGGDRISCSTDIQSTSVEAAKALRAQILGLANNPDEPYVPVTFTEDSDLDGYYTVEDCQVSTTPVSLVAFTFGVSISLRRVPNYALPEAQSVVLGATRSNDMNVSSAALYSAYWTAIPTAEGYYYPGSITERSSATGTVYTLHTTSALGAGDQTSQYTTLPADWYDGAATVEVLRSATYYTVIGRQIHTGTSGIGWRISNGLIRVSLESGALKVEGYDGTGWGTDKKYALKNTLGDTVVYFTFAILRNSPEEVAIRLSHRGSTNNKSNGYLDIRLRRGARNIECIAVYPSTTDTYGSISRTSNEAGTNVAIGGTLVGLCANADDADGNKYFLASAYTVNTGTTVGTIGATTEATWPFTIGIATAATDGETPQQLISQYFFPYTERVTLVGR